jgi:uncharacterized RDD family membrane protein YckC
MKITGVFNKERFIALSIDSSVAIVLVLFLSIVLRDRPGWLKGLVMIFTYLGYFIVSEGLWSRTLGKYYQRLIVRKLNGEKAGWREASIRGLLVFFELNPILLGGLPAGLAVLSSDRKQRVGDMIAGTVVVSDKLSWGPSDIDPPGDIYLMKSQEDPSNE